ncbi:MAG: hypothetical protein RSC28_06190 [Bacteroidales bacterium]
MKMLRIFFLTTAALLCFTALCAQEQPKEKSPQEYAALEAERLEKELNLNTNQVFYVDSIFQVNFAGVMKEFDDMKKSGMQDGRSYQAVREKWTQKNLDALKLILTEQQYISYLKLIGKGKEYKKGKDGLYYKKETKSDKSEKK